MPHVPNITPDTSPEARALLERAIECLIAYLDPTDGDPDMEDNGDAEDEHDAEADTADDEPSVGSTGGLFPDDQRVTWGAGSGVTDDREKTGYTAETEDDEPSLGWGAGRDFSQSGLTQGYAPDGTEKEPSLGWTTWEAGNGRYAWMYCSDESEPSLGWQNEGSQQALRSGGADEAEADTADDEPSLASPNCIGSFYGIDAVMSGGGRIHSTHSDWNQCLWSSGNTKDLEDEHDGREEDGR